MRRPSLVTKWKHPSVVLGHWSLEKEQTLLILSNESTNEEGFELLL